MAAQRIVACTIVYPIIFFVAKHQQSAEKLTRLLQRKQVAKATKKVEGREKEFQVDDQLLPYREH
jgi:hypothetical protein